MISDGSAYVPSAWSSASKVLPIVRSMRLLVGLPVIAALAAGCASDPAPRQAASTAPAGSRVYVVYDLVILTGYTDGSTGQSTCGPAEPKYVVEVPEPGKAMITLRPTDGAAPLSDATLRVTKMDTNQTWCAAMKDDAVTLRPPEELPKGLYAVSVAGGGSELHRYEIRWEQL
jgi:hypothetical protein